MKSMAHLVLCVFTLGCSFLAVVIVSAPDYMSSRLKFAVEMKLQPRWGKSHEHGSTRGGVSGISIKQELASLAQSYLIKFTYAEQRPVLNIRE